MAQVLLETLLRNQVDAIAKHKIAYFVPSFVTDRGLLPLNMFISSGKGYISMEKSEHHRKDTKKGRLFAKSGPNFVDFKKISYFCTGISFLNHTYMFKEKIVEGLRAKSEIKRFGLSNEAIDRIASAREKTITEESQVEDALTDAETMRLVADELMKHRDQEITKRTTTQSAFDAYKAAHPESGSGDGSGSGSGSGHGDSGSGKGDIAAIVQAAVAAAVKPLQDKIDGFESNQAAKNALETAKAKFFGGDYAKHYKDQADEAWERATELNEATGSKMSADELSQKAEGYFNKAVSKLGVDTSKPFEADPNNTEKGVTDWKAEKARQDARHGIKPAEQQ